jgi:hypothetical protein
LAASGLSVVIAENVLLSELSEIVGVVPEFELEPEEDGVLLLLLPQAAITRAAEPATAVSMALLVTEYTGTPSLVSGTCQEIGR